MGAKASHMWVLAGSVALCAAPACRPPTQLLCRAPARGAQIHSVHSRSNAEKMRAALLVLLAGLAAGVRATSCSQGNYVCVGSRWALVRAHVMDQPGGREPSERLRQGALAWRLCANCSAPSLPRPQNSVEACDRQIQRAPAPAGPAPSANHCGVLSD